MPVNQAMNPTAMNRPIFIRPTGTPTARAAGAFPPTAKIQLPTRVRSRIHVAIRTKTIQQRTVMLTLTPPISKLVANTAFAELKPWMLEMSGLATWLVMVRVSARFSPSSMKNVPRVTRKLGMPVRVTIQPLMNPTSSAITSATATPTHTFTVNSKLNKDAASAAVMTATPAERSNSPPIMSSAIGVAIRP